MSSNLQNETDGWNTIKPKTKQQLQEQSIKETKTNNVVAKALVINEDKQQIKEDKGEENNEAEKNKISNKEKELPEKEFIIVEKQKKYDYANIQNYSKQKEEKKTSEKIIDSISNTENIPQSTYISNFGSNGNEKFTQFRMRLNEQTKRYYYFHKQFFKIYNCQQINSLESTDILKLKDDQSEIFQKLRNIILSYLNGNGGIIFFGFSPIMKNDQPHMEVNGFDITQTDQKRYDTLLNAMKIIQNRIQPQSFNIQVSIMKIRKDNKNKNTNVINNKYVSRIVVQQGSDLSSLYIYKESPKSIEISARYSIQDKSFYTIKGPKLIQALEQKKVLVRIPELSVTYIDDFLDPQSSYRYQKNSQNIYDGDDNDNYSYDSNEDQSFSNASQIDEDTQPDHFSKQNLTTNDNKVKQIPPPPSQISNSHSKASASDEKGKDYSSSQSSLQSDQNIKSEPKNEIKGSIKAESFKSDDPWNVELPKDNLQIEADKLKQKSFKPNTEEFPSLGKAPLSAEGDSSSNESFNNNNNTRITSTSPPPATLLNKKTCSSIQMNTKPIELPQTLKNKQQSQPQTNLIQSDLAEQLLQQEDIALSSNQQYEKIDDLQNQFFQNLSSSQFQEQQFLQQSFQQQPQQQQQQQQKLSNYSSTQPFFNNLNNNINSQYLDQTSELMAGYNLMNGYNYNQHQQQQQQSLLQQQQQQQLQQFQLQQQQYQQQQQWMNLQSNQFQNNQNLISQSLNDSHIAKILPKLSDNQLCELIGVLDAQQRNYCKYLSLAYFEEFSRKPAIQNYFVDSSSLTGLNNNNNFNNNIDFNSSNNQQK